jgi:hypothetical protein
LIMNLRCEPVTAPGAVPDRAGAGRGRRPKRARPWSGGPAPSGGSVQSRCQTPSYPAAMRRAAGYDGASQFRAAARDHQCGHVIVVPGDLMRDGPADWQALPPRLRPQRRPRPRRA